jgi:hypothetical protein
MHAFGTRSAIDQAAVIRSVHRLLLDQLLEPTRRAEGHACQHQRLHHRLPMAIMQVCIVLYCTIVPNF